MPHLAQGLMELAVSPTETQPNCLICFQPCEEIEDVCLPCGHWQWHYHCIQGWLDRQASCPLCRAPAVEEDALSGSEPSGDETDCEERLALSLEAQLLANRELERLELLELQARILQAELEDLRQEERQMEIELGLDASSHVQKEAHELLCRFTAAAFRTNLDGAHLFAALSPQGVPLAVEALSPVLSDFGGVSDLAVAAACRSLDFNQSGWVEEEDLHEVLRRYASLAAWTFDDGSQD
mmetsp:Transcript_58700/g.137447  ORF Transcript_58700/g.137447 Transcript_58700/m.137447 type:complete len:239 (+) Transcript_58700:53-769(+)